MSQVKIVPTRPRPTVEQYVIRSTSRSYALGAAFGAILSLGATALLGYRYFTEADSKLLVTFFSLALQGVLLSFAAIFVRKGWIGRAGYGLLFMGLTLLPLIEGAICAWLYPERAAFLLHGPTSTVILLQIIASGLVLDARLSFFCGILGTAGYLALSEWTAPQLAPFSSTSPDLYAELGLFSVRATKALVFCVAGCLVAVISWNSRRLIAQFARSRNRIKNIDTLFGQFVSPEVKRRIRAAPSGQLAERVHAVILFADLRAFTTYTEKESPERVVTRLNEFYDRMIDCVREHGGTVDKLIGDSIMAVFGGLVHLEDPAQAAFNAALSMQNALSELNSEWTKKGEPGFAIGIGIHSGVVVQGTIGSSDRKEFTVIGDPVNTASRVENFGKTSGYSIVITEEVLRQLPPSFSSGFVSLGSAHLKGKALSVNLHGWRPGEPSARAG